MSRMLVMPIGVMKLIFMRYMLIIIFINIHGRLWGAIVVDFDHLVPGETWILGWLHIQPDCFVQTVWQVLLFTPMPEIF